MCLSFNFFVLNPRKRKENVTHFLTWLIKICSKIRLENTLYKYGSKAVIIYIYIKIGDDDEDDNNDDNKNKNIDTTSPTNTTTANGNELKENII